MLFVTQIAVAAARLCALEGSVVRGQAPSDGIKFISHPKGEWICADRKHRNLGSRFSGATRFIYKWCAALRHTRPSTTSRTTASKRNHFHATFTSKYSHNCSKPSVSKCFHSLSSCSSQASSYTGATCTQTWSLHRTHQKCKIQWIGMLFVESCKGRMKPLQRLCNSKC